MVADSDIAFRVRGISDNCTREDITQRIRDHYQGTQPRVKSLARDPTRNAKKIATLSFEELPDKLKKARKDKDPITEYIEISEDGNETDWEFGDDFEGFTPLHSTHDDDCDVDIIAITGLNGHAFGSFKHKGRGKMWLRDFLPKDYERARIFTYGYNTRKPSSQSITNLAERFTSLLTLMRENSRPRPWIVIGHSLGGLLAKAAIKDMAESKRKVDVDTYKSLRAVSFFGVPSDGMNIEAIKPMFSGPALHHLLETIDELRPIFLREIQARFFTAVSKLDEFISFNFFETGLSSTHVTVKPKVGRFRFPEMSGEGEPKQLVSEPSATQGNPCGNYPRHQNFSVNCSHSDLVKFSSQNDDTYKIVVNRLQKLKIGNQTPLEGQHASTQGFVGFTEIEQACLRSLAFKEMDWHEGQGVLVPQEGTCQWLLKHEWWRSTYQTMMCICGPPGSGKSTLMKFAMRQLKSEQLDKREIVAGFFIRGDGPSDLQKTPLGIYRSLLHQLLQHFPSHLQSLALVFEKQQRFRGEFGMKWDWTEDQLRDFLLVMLRDTCNNDEQKVFLFVDGLDGLGYEHASEVLRLFTDFILEPRRIKLSLKIFVSGWLLTTVPGIIFAVAMPLANAQDIAFQVRNFPVFRAIRSGYGEALQNFILEQAEGSFRWVSSVLNLILEMVNRREPYQAIFDKAIAVPHPWKGQRAKGTNQDKKPEAPFQAPPRCDNGIVPPFSSSPRPYNNITVPPFHASPPPQRPNVTARRFQTDAKIDRGSASFL